MSNRCLCHVRVLSGSWHSSCKVTEFGRGTAADCRRHVQKLNTLRGQMLEMNSCFRSNTYAN
uniref:MRN complex-interacting protein N-terminal domain-containing protein n=1 Tax=Sinocyclocheilus anshuiensis TaxID=1608454 RepID=A0A671LNI0_9TELE